MQAGLRLAVHCPSTHRLCPAPPAETFNALLLAKSLRQRLWTGSELETRQLSGIGPLIAQRLAAAGVTKLQQLDEIEPRRLEALAQRHYPFGACAALC